MFTFPHFGFSVRLRAGGLVLIEGKFLRFGGLLDAAEKSFIERRFIVALLMSEQFSFEPLHPPLLAIARDAHGVTLDYRVPVGRYFVDFTLTHERVPLRLAVELDGHQWHRRTPEEAEYEARRDRDIVAAGWTVVRYMGREVMRDPAEVVRDAYARVRRSIGPGLVSGTVPPTLALPTMEALRLIAT